MAEYSQADFTVISLLKNVIETRYPRIQLLSPPLDICVLMVSSKPGTPALKKGGWPALGMVSVVSTKDRAAGGPDVLIQLDERYWDRVDSLRRRAMLDHELYHVEVAARTERDGDDGPIVRYVAECDCLDRPVVTLRPHDFEVGGFKEICEIYGSAAPERHAVNEINLMLDEPTLPFMREQVEPIVETPIPAAASKAPSTSKGPINAQAQI